jgi:recombination protein RecT
MNAASAPAKAVDLRAIIEKQTSQFAMLMPAETVDRFKRIFWTTINEKPDLQRCEPRSLLSVCMHAAQDGLYLDGKEAAIVPFKSDRQLIATYVPMIVGLRKKVRASELIADWNCQVVFENDQFDIGFGDRPYLHHKPALTGSGKRKIVGAYSIAWFKDGGHPSIEWMTIEQIEEIRGKSKAEQAGRGSPWSDPVFYPEMVRKTVARRHAKQLPMASDIENVFRHEEDSRTQIDEQVSSQPVAPFTLPRGADRSVADTLDEFASGSLPAGDTSHTTSSVADERGGGAQDHVETDRPSTLGDPGAAGTSSPENVDPPQREGVRMPTQDDVNEAVRRGKSAAEIATAFKRGQDAKKAGQSRKTLPGEYRENPKLFNAWFDGFDKQPEV